MSLGEIILGIVLFALVTAVLYIWGLKKSITQSQDLQRILLHKSASAVVNYLKKHGTMEEAEMARQIAGIRAGVFWSRRRAAIQDPEQFVPRLVAYMTGQQLIERMPDGQFRLKK